MRRIVYIGQCGVVFMQVVRLLAIVLVFGLILFLVVLAFNLGRIRCEFKQANLSSQCAKINNPSQCQNAVVSFSNSTQVDEKFSCVWDSTACEAPDICSQEE